MIGFHTPIGFTGDDGDYDALISQCESEFCGQHYGEAQRVHMLSLGTGEVVAVRILCLKAQDVARQNYCVTLATDADEMEAMREPLRMAA